MSSNAVADSFTLEGPGGSNGFKVAYLDYREGPYAAEEHCARKYRALVRYGASLEAPLNPRHLVRLVVPDSHGEHIDLAARASFLADVKRLVPDEVIWLGDHVDCGGVFSVHQRSYTKELTEAYEDDIAAANSLLDAVQKLAPKARHWYILGNHEDHVERWASRSFSSHKDAELVLRHIGPIKLLRLRERGFTVIKSTETYNGLSVPGAMRRGKCHFTHGISASKHAADAHLRGFGASVVFGHCHRSMSVIERSVASSGHGAWCPGTLAKIGRASCRERVSSPV